MFLLYKTPLGKKACKSAFYLIKAKNKKAQRQGRHPVSTQRQFVYFYRVLPFYFMLSQQFMIVNMKKTKERPVGDGSLVGLIN